MISELKQELRSPLKSEFVSRDEKFSGKRFSRLTAVLDDDPLADRIEEYCKNQPQHQCV